MQAAGAMRGWRYCQQISAVPLGGRPVVAAAGQAGQAPVGGQRDAGFIEFGQAQYAGFVSLVHQHAEQVIGEILFLARVGFDVFPEQGDGVVVGAAGFQSRSGLVAQRRVFRALADGQQQPLDFLFRVAAVVFAG